MIILGTLSDFNFNALYYVLLTDGFDYYIWTSAMYYKFMVLNMWYYTGDICVNV